MYQQQYPQPYPYYFPYPPPKKDDKKLALWIVVIVVILIVVPIIMSVILYLMVIGVAPNGHYVPTGSWGSMTIVSRTEIVVDFGRISPEPEPVDLAIILRRNGTQEGMYTFATNNDGPLILTSGSDVGTLRYADLADNQRVNIGDQLRMSNLTPGSDYVVIMIWNPTGDQLAARPFSTPP